MAPVEPAGISAQQSTAVVIVAEDPLPVISAVHDACPAVAIYLWSEGGCRLGKSKSLKTKLL